MAAVILRDMEHHECELLYIEGVNVRVASPAVFVQVLLCGYLLLEELWGLMGEVRGGRRLEILCVRVFLRHKQCGEKRVHMPVPQVR